VAHDLDKLLELVAAAPSVALDAVDLGLEAGTVVAEQFRVDAKVGTGGMGTVYRARDLVLGRDVALKVVRRAVDELPESEAQHTARLNHPNVVTLYQVCRHEDRTVLVLELLRGETLADRLERGSLALDDALAIGADIAAALAHAHALGVTHHDLNPRNVFLTEDGPTKLLDFGLASGVADSVNTGGTPGFMAPEQLAGDTTGPATDVFAAGTLLYLCLVGTLPFRAPSPELAAPNLPFDLVRQSPRLQTLFDAALAARSEDRFEDGGALGEAIEEVRRSLNALRRRRRRRSLVQSLAAVTAIVAMTWSFVWWQSRGPNDDDLDAIVGRWRSQGGHVGSLQITKDPAGGYRWLEVQDERVRVPSHAFFRNSGAVTVEAREYGYVFHARVTDEEGWCCRNRGEIELEMYDEDTLYIRTSRWWNPHGRIVKATGPYALYRVEE
jgi:hypothetical protein